MNILFAFISFILIFIVYYILILRNEKTLEKFKKSTEILYLKKLYKIKINQHNLKSIAYKVVLANCLIISLTIYIVSIVDNIALKIFVSMGVMIPLIIIIYHILGKTLKEK